MRILKIPYTTEPGTIVYRIKASDADNDDIIFDVLEDYGKTLIRFDKINQNEANVILLCPLNKDSEYNLTIYANGGDETTYIESRIIVTDIDGISTKEYFPFVIDNDPVYVFENVSLNNSIAIIKAYEQESSELPVSFELLEDGNIFHFRYIFGPRGITIAEIILLKSLDYEQQNLYILTILAINGKTRQDIDTRNVHQTYLTIVVKDVQDTPPKFENLPQTTHINVSYRPNQTLYTVQAQDGDITNKRDLIYQIKKPNDRFFRINSNGTISTPFSFDELNELYDVRTPITLRIEAHEIVKRDLLPKNLADNNNNSSSTSTQSHLIIIFQLNNRKPYFSQPQFTANIDEHSPYLTSVRWSNGQNPRVSDPDYGLNGTFKLKAYDPTNTFIISPMIGYRNLTFTLLVNDSNSLDYEKYHNLSIHLSVQDTSEEQPLSSNVTCTIFIHDINDNYPEFTESRYYSSMLENAAKGTTVTTLSATDKDTGDFGRIRFTDIRGPFAQNFNIDPVIGTIILIDNNNIDRESMEEIFLTIEARDNNGQGNRNMTELYIQILDVNDNPPLFLQPYYLGIIKNDLNEFIHPLKLDAIDIDQINTTNSMVNYEILQGNFENMFEIDRQNGRIKLTRSDINQRSSSTLNAIPNLINLTVRAYDLGIPQLSSLVKVFIYVLNTPTYLSTLFSTNKILDIRNGNSSLEKSLSLITGGNVTVKELRSPETPNEPIKIVTMVRYQNENIIDLDNLAAAYQNLFYIPPQTQPSTISRSTLPSTIHATNIPDTVPVVTSKNINQQQTFIGRSHHHHQEVDVSSSSASKISRNQNIHQDVNDYNDGINEQEHENDPLVVRTSSTAGFFNFLMYFLLVLIILFLIFLCILCCCCCWKRRDSQTLFGWKNVWFLQDHKSSDKFHKRKRRSTESHPSQRHYISQHRKQHSESKAMTISNHEQQQSKQMAKQESIVSYGHHDNDWFRALERKLENEDGDVEYEIKEEKKYSSTPRTMSYCISKKIIRPKHNQQQQPQQEHSRQVDILNLENGTTQVEHHRIFPRKKNSIMPLGMIKEQQQKNDKNQTKINFAINQNEAANSKFKQFNQQTSNQAIGTDILPICPQTMQRRSIFSIAYDGIEHRENISSSESNQTITHI